MHGTLLCFTAAFEIASLLSPCGDCDDEDRTCNVYDGVGGSSLPNGLPPEIYLGHQLELEGRMAARVTRAPSTLDSDSFASILVDSEGGPMLVKYALGCAVNNSCREVIRTALKCDAWCSLYPGCNVPEGCNAELHMKTCPPTRVSSARGQ